MKRIPDFVICFATTPLLLALLQLAGCGSSSLTMTSFSPLSGAVGTTLTITGSGFSTTAASNRVSFQGTSATVTSATGTTLVTTVPSGATNGAISVTVDGQTASSTSSFTVIPTMTSFSPSSGSAGTAVTITGTGFDATPANNLVYFNGIRATLTSASATALVATVPAGATSGVLIVTVNGVSVSSSSHFTVN